MEGFPLFVSGEARAHASAAKFGEGRLRRETVEGFPLFVSGGARAEASAATPGEGRLRRETVKGFPLFVARGGPSRRRAPRYCRRLCGTCSSITLRSPRLWYSCFEENSTRSTMPRPPMLRWSKSAWVLLMSTDAKGS